MSTSGSAQCSNPSRLQIQASRDSRRCGFGFLSDSGAVTAAQAFHRRIEVAEVPDLQRRGSFVLQNWERKGTKWQVSAIRGYAGTLVSTRKPSHPPSMTLLGNCEAMLYSPRQMYFHPPSLNSAMSKIPSARPPNRSIAMSARTRLRRYFIATIRFAGAARKICR
jgi:hypothetical protein